VILKVLLTGVLRLLTLNLQESTGTKTFSFHANAMLTTFSSVLTSYHIFFVPSNKPAVHNLSTSCSFTQHCICKIFLTKPAFGIFLTVVKGEYNNLHSHEYIKKIAKKKNPPTPYDL
jgi:hypothetical protein